MNIIFLEIIFLFQLISVELKEKEIHTNTSKTNNKEQKIELLELNDSNFDLVIQNGKNNRWLILFYLQTCYHCSRARTIINRILEFQEYKIINNIKFASIEIENNTKTNIRFNISQVPYIILVENNTMFEFDNYANEKNLINFIETNFTNVTNELKSFPSRNIFKYYYKKFDNSLTFVLEEVNTFLKSKNINFKFNAITFILGYTIFCFIFWMIVIYGFMKCCAPNSKKKKQKKNIVENKDNIEKNTTSIEEKNNNENEDTKKIIEEKKEEEYKEKNINKEDSTDKEFKKGKKKKKE